MGKRQDNIDKAVAEAVSAIYFNDSSDYLTALYAVVRALDPDTCKLLETGEQIKAYKKYHPED